MAARDEKGVSLYGYLDVVVHNMKIHLALILLFAFGCNIYSQISDLIEITVVDTSGIPLPAAVLYIDNNYQTSNFKDLTNNLSIQKTLTTNDGIAKISKENERYLHILQIGYESKTIDLAPNKLEYKVILQKMRYDSPVLIIDKNIPEINWAGFCGEFPTYFVKYNEIELIDTLINGERFKIENPNHRVDSTLFYLTCPLAEPKCGYYTFLNKLAVKLRHISFKKIEIYFSVTTNNTLLITKIDGISHHNLERFSNMILSLDSWEAASTWGIKIETDYKLKIIKK